MLNKEIEQDIYNRLKEITRPRRRAFSLIFPVLKRPAIFAHRHIRYFKDAFSGPYAQKKDSGVLPVVVARHQSLLVRRLGNSDPVLQKNKIKNLSLAIEQINGVIIRPGEVFSFWKLIGKPSYRRGFIDGMLLSDGQVSKGVGGGLCQLSNFLTWIFLHADFQLVERYHHSVDAFPDSGRVLPFGSGATVCYNFFDLKAKNIGSEPLQLKLWLTDKHLKGQLLAGSKPTGKFHLFERNHLFVLYQGHYYRYNQIFRTLEKDGKIFSEEKVFTNFAPVVYDINEQYLRENSVKLLKLIPFDTQ